VVTGEPLPGGFVSGVYRVGETVRRTAPERFGLVLALLQLLADRDWAGAPDRRAPTSTAGRFSRTCRESAL
jgi:hypothetical protein